MEHIYQTAGSRCKTSSSSTLWFWLVFPVAAIFGLGPVSECIAFTVSPTVLAFNSTQGAENPQNQTFSVYRKRTSQITLTDSDNASWLTVSPATTSLTTSAQLTVAVNTSGLAAGTYNATITVKVGKATTTVPVTLTVSPSQPPPSATTATLAWNAVIDPFLSGYTIHVGTASGLYTRTITVGNVTSFTVDSLTTGTTYYFAVTAYNTAGESPPSNEVSKSIY